MNIDVSYYTSIGGRDNNEDFLSLAETKDRIVAIVADGLGGHSSGEIASQLAVKTIISELANKELSVCALERAVELANSKILNDSSSDSMKTTVAVVWTTKKKALFATVGDTRIYHFRNNQVIYQTIDHSVSQMSVMAGEITVNQIRGHKDRNKLVRVLGHKEKVKADIIEVDLEPHDAILICSDGFWENIIENDMSRALSHSKDSKEWLEEMKEIVESTATEDNDNNSAIAFFVNK